MLSKKTRLPNQCLELPALQLAEEGLTLDGER